VLEEPREDGSILFVSGDGRDKAYVWSVNKRVPGNIFNEELKEDDTPNNTIYESFKIHELEGHTETVEYCKFDSSGRWMVTAGMNNMARVWDVANGFVLKTLIEEIPIEDMNFVEWHPTAPLFLIGGKDYMIWMVNAVSGKVMANFIGHEEEVLMARFSLFDGGKQVVSCSSDKTVRLWSPIKGECLMTVRNGTGKMPYHEEAI
jgi:WD40 repeat protein